MTSTSHDTATEVKPVKTRLLAWSKDIAIIAIVIVAVLTWQSRNLLEADGTVQIVEQNFVTLEGDVFSLQKNDKKTVMYFFAPWCSICRYSINNLNVIDKSEYNIVRVALDYQAKEEVSTFVESVGVQGAILLGNREHKQAFNISGYPTYYVLDKDLNVISNDMGYSSSLGIKLRTSF